MEKLKPNEQAALRKLKDALARDFRLVELRLIGSKARGDSSIGSDIDVVIVLKAYDWVKRREIYGVCFDISLEYDVLLSPKLFTEEEFNSTLTRATPFYESIVREGVAV